jgi:cobalt/nickel transport system ATP-binding protein
MGCTLSLRDVSVRHEPDMPPAISGVSFSVDEGERVALVGLNGSGKTTLLLAIAGLVEHQGEICVCGEMLSRRSASSIRKKIGFLFNVPEDQLLFPRVVEDVAFGLIRSGTGGEEARQRAREMLDRLGIESLHPLPLHHLSHGQKQRVALAGALITRPPLLLLDEPSAGLDPPGRLELARILEAEGSAQVIATHDLDFAERVSTRTIFLHDGTIDRGASTIPHVRNRWTGA